MDSTNWAGNYRYRAARVHRPESVGELQELVAASDRLRALGSRHSFNDIADTPGDQVSLDGLPPELSIDERERTVTVNAGARYGEFVERLGDAGWAIHNLASLPHITVAGAIATGTHGSGDRNGSLAAVVAWLELVTAPGELLRVKRGDPDFDGMVVSLGALGVVTRVTLDIEPAFEVRQDVFEHLPWPRLLAHFDEITASAYSVSLFTDWGDGGITQAWLKSRTDVPTDLAALPGFFDATRAATALHPLPGGPSHTTTEQGGVPGPWWNRLAHFRLAFTPSNGQELQTEYLVGREHALAAIDAVRAMRARIRPHLFITEIRTVKADALWLSPSFARDSVAIHFTWKQHEQVQALLPAIEAALAPFAARPHWGKLFTTDAATLATLYPRLADFRTLATRLDPAGVFRNGYLERTIFST